MRSEVVEYSVRDLPMQSHLYLPDSDGRAPGVLVFSDLYGISDHTKARAQQLAALGFVALACDLHGRGRVLTDMDELRHVRKSLIYNPPETRARGRGGFDALIARPEVDPGRVAAIGFCFGGRMALELGRAGLDLAAIVAFHAGLGTEAKGDARNIKAKVLVCTGSEDSIATAEDRAAFETEMKQGGVDWQIHLYGGAYHSFTMPHAPSMGRPDFARYDPVADARSWRSMLNLFDEVF